MAEIAVKVAIDLLVPLITSEVSLISKLSEDVKAIKNELESISAFLKSAEERAIGDEETKVWVKQVRSLAYDIEDVVEKYWLFETDNRFGKLKSYLSFHPRELANTIKFIRGRAIEIGRWKDSYKLDNNNNDRVSIRIRSDNYHQQLGTSSATLVRCMQSDNEVVGFVKHKRVIIDLLIKGHHYTTTTTVAVVGMRGVGKTTLVQYTCKDDEIKKHFPLRAMISLTKTPTRTELSILRSLVKQFHENKQLFNDVNFIHSMDRNALQDLISQILKDKRYLVVFDDAQNNDTQIMSYIKTILLSANNGDSKILVTTRNADVARAWLDGSDHGLYQLEPLPQPDAWLLFCKKTFQRFGGKCPPNLEDLAQGIVQNCKGLPPAILALGLLLSTKLNDLVEWQKVYDSFGFYLEKNCHLTGIHEIFTRNYYDLPSHLKPCFLYFGVFPKGFRVDKMRLIRLWVAEGFITKRYRDAIITLEEIAEERLNELISMSLVEVAYKDSTGTPKTLRVNEFLHEVILSKLDELSFCHILSQNYLLDKNDEKPRRLSIHNKYKLCDACKFLKDITKVESSIRCLFAFGLNQDDILLAKVLDKTFLKKVLLLKVLDLRDAPITEVPLALGKLRNLRYLSLRNTRVSMLPTSIGKLQNLQTLDLKQTLIHELPNEITELQNLRHLLIYSYKHDLGFDFHIQRVRGAKLPQGALLGKFTELQKLAFLDMRNGTKVTKELKNLRRLGIIGLKSEDGIDLCVAIQEMRWLQALNLYSENKSEINLEDFQSSPPPKTLKRLYLNGVLRCFPSWISHLHNLVKIRLRWSSLEDAELFEKMSALPNLMELQLLEAYKGTFLEIKNGGFVKLKILKLLDLHQLEELLINNTALPLLEHLSIGESQKLQVPLGIKHLRNLKTLELLNMPQQFIDDIQPDHSYYSIEEHVPEVILRFRCEQGYWT